MPKFSRALGVTLLAAGLLAAAPAAADVNLEAAKAAGLVGERPDGLLGAVSGDSAEIAALIAAINTRRLSQYEEIARRTGTSLPAVQAVAGRKAIEQAPTGSYVMDDNGGWRRK